MILFRCDSVYQLMNAIQIKLSLLPGQPADMILSDHTNFEDIVPGLEKSKIFDSIYRLYSKEDAQNYWKFSKEERKEVSLHPESYVDIGFLTKQYTDFYLSFDTAYAKLMYYEMIQRGMRLNVHLFEDGMATYICDVEKRCSEDGMQHNAYGEQKFLSNISELLLYEPELFTGPKVPFVLRAIPRISYEKKEIRDLFTGIFHTAPMPKEKYIFLEEAFTDDKIPSNDLELCLEIAEIVGKENMMVKLHPRNRINRFQAYGFKTMQQTAVPWEMLLMNHDIRKKILITISSNASITSKLIFHKDMNVIMLYKMFIGRTWLMTNQNFEQYHRRAVRKFNEKRKNIYCPNSMEEIKEILNYIGGLQRIEERDSSFAGCVSDYSGV